MKKILNSLKNFFSSVIKFADKRIIIPIAKLVTGLLDKFSKEGKYIEKILVRKNSLVIISLILALVIFFVVDNESNILTETSAEVVYNQTVIAEYNEEAYVIEGLPETVDITLIGRRSDLYLAKQISSHNVTVDLTGLDEGVHKVKLQYTQAIQSVEYKLDPSEATIVISKKESEKKLISSDILNSDKLDETYSVKSVSLSRDEVVVKGTSQTIESIASIKALVDVSEISNAKVGENELTHVPLMAYDKTGNPVEVELVPSSVDVKVNIVSPKAELPVKIIPKGSVIFGKAISNMTSDISTITVYGDEDVINEMENFEIEVDVDGLGADKEYNVTLSKPVGITSMSVSNVKVRVSLGTEITREITGVGISAVNLDTSLYTAQAADEDNRTVTVIVKGVEDAVNNITADSITAKVDLEGYREGKYDVPVQISGTDLKVTYIAKETTKSIQISKK